FLAIQDLRFFIIFFFNDTVLTEIYTLSLHDALPIFFRRRIRTLVRGVVDAVRMVGLVEVELVNAARRAIEVDIAACGVGFGPARDRKSTRLNSSHLGISYAVFCLKKKKTA